MKSYKQFAESADTSKEIEKIAKKYFNIDTLKTRSSDSKDFYDVAVWQMKDALNAAYELGKASK